MRGLGEGASALYGSDAVADVVNTILRKDYDGAEATIRHGGADDGSMDETSATFLGGKNFNDGRTNVMGFVGYYHRDALEASSKDFTQTPAPPQPPRDANPPPNTPPPT